MGAIFFPMVINADKTYDLQTVSVQGGDWEMGEFMEPSNDCIKLFEFGSTYVPPENKYTYISEGWLKFNFCDYDDQWKEYKWAIGWWKFEKDYDYWTAVCNGNAEDGDPDGMMIREPIMVTIGQCFLGALSQINLRFVSNGQVVQETTAYDTLSNKSAYFINYLPIDLELNDIEVEGGDWEMGEFMEPSNDCIKQFEFGSTYVPPENKYTYVSEGWLKFNFCDYEDQWKEYEWAIGWWKWVKDYDYWTAVCDGNAKDLDPDGMMFKNPIASPAGQGYLGVLSQIDLHFKFPNPTNLPKREQK